MLLGEQHRRIGFEVTKKTTQEALAQGTTFNTAAMAEVYRTVKRLSRAELVDMRESLEIEAYQNFALRAAVLRDPAIATRAGVLTLEDTTASLLAIARCLESIDKTIARARM